MIEGAMVNWPEFVTGIFGGVTGSLVVVYGLSRWLGDVWKAKILEKVQQANRSELETLKSEMQASVEKANRLLDAGISKAIMVTRTHFETEFAAYKEIFAALSDVKNCLHATRPVFIIAGEGDRVRDKVDLVDRLNKLIAAHNKAVVVSENLGPFYQDEIYQGIQKCFSASKYEILQVKTGSHETFSEEWFEDGRKRQEAFTEDYIRVSKLIRERLASLGVLPE
jgi:hypothetical protein